MYTIRARLCTCASLTAHAYVRARERQREREREREREKKKEEKKKIRVCACVCWLIVVFPPDLGFLFSFLSRESSASVSGCQRDLLWSRFVVVDLMADVTEMRREEAHSEEHALGFSVVCCLACPLSLRRVRCQTHPDGLGPPCRYVASASLLQRRQQQLQRQRQRQRQGQGQGQGQGEGQGQGRGRAGQGSSSSGSSGSSGSSSKSRSPAGRGKRRKSHHHARSCTCQSLDALEHMRQHDDYTKTRKQAASSEKFPMQSMQILSKLFLENAMDVRECCPARCPRFVVNALSRPPRPTTMITLSLKPKKPLAAALSCLDCLTRPWWVCHLWIPWMMWRSTSRLRILPGTRHSCVQGQENLSSRQR